MKTFLPHIALTVIIGIFAGFSFAAVNSFVLSEIDSFTLFSLVTGSGAKQRQNDA